MKSVENETEWKKIKSQIFINSAVYIGFELYATFYPPNGSCIVNKENWDKDIKDSFIKKDCQIFIKEKDIKAIRFYERLLYGKYDIIITKYCKTMDKAKIIKILINTNNLPNEIQTIINEAKMEEL